MTEFVLATANPDKAREIAEILGPSVRLLRRPDWVAEVDETGETLLDNARLKARAVADATNRPAIADDTGLEVEDLGGQPGVRSARFAGERATYGENVAKLISTMEDRPGARLARFRTVAVAAWPDGHEVVAEGVVDGVIAKQPRGRSGFGYDPVFVPDEGDGRTFAEMSPEEKNRLSHRSRAFRCLATNLNGQAGPAVAETSEAEPTEPAISQPDSPRRHHLGLGVDLALAALVGLAVLAVHDVGYMLHHPFWLDEAWVADSTRARLGLLPWVTGPTPLGWTLLLRLVPFGGEQALRVVPLAFAGLTATAGYLFGRELRLTRYVTGILTGAAALLAPAMLVRDDLKQYTAEAFASVLLLYLVARIENQWNRKTLAAIGLVTGLGLFFANAVVFVGVAAMAGLGLECLITRKYPRLIEVGVATAGMLALTAVVYAAVDLPHQISSLTSYWDPYYVPRNQGFSGATHFIHIELAQLAPYFGFHSLRLNAVLALAGLVSLIWLKRYALALMIPLTVVLVIGASAARKYPFGDLRTSTFWTVMITILIAIAAATVIRLLESVNRPVAIIGAAAALAVWIPATHPFIRSHPLSVEDVRSQVAYLNQHRGPGDIVILSYSASYGFAYYDTELTPTFKHIDYASTGFLPTFPHVPWLVQMPNRNASDVTTALAKATALVAAEGGKGRIWIVRSHLEPTEATAWTRELAGKQVTVIPVGTEPLLLYQPS